MCTNTGGTGRAGNGAGANGAPALDSNLVKRANESSVTDIGDSTVRAYQRNAEFINGTVLDDSEKREAISKLHELTIAQLEAEADTVNPYATGRGVARFDRQLTGRTGDKAINARLAVEDHIKSVREREHTVIRQRQQKAMTDAMANALSNGLLEFNVNGATYRRKSKRAKSFERVYS